MTPNQLRKRARDRLFRAGVPSDELGPAELDELLSQQMAELAHDFETYKTTKAIVVTAGKNQFTLAEVTPYLAGSSDGEGLDTIINAVYQRGTVGNITAVAAATSQMYSGDHGLTTGDKIQIFNTGEALGSAAGAAVNGYDGNALSVTVVNTSEFKVAGKTYNADYGNDRGVWIKESAAYDRVQMARRSPGEVEEYLYNPQAPSSADIPAGIVIVTALLHPPKLKYWNDDAIIPGWVFPLSFQQLIADMAVEEYLMKDPSVKTIRKQQQLEEWRAANDPRRRKRFGRFDRGDGLYSFQHTAERALIIAPAWW